MDLQTKVVLATALLFVLGASLAMNVYGIQNIQHVTGTDPKKSPVQYAADAGMWGTVGINVVITLIIIVMVFRSYKNSLYRGIAILLLLGAVAADLTFMIMLSAQAPNIPSPYIPVYALNGISYFIRTFYVLDLMFNDYASIFGGRRR